MNGDARLVLILAMLLVIVSVWIFIGALVIRNRAKKKPSGRCPNCGGLVYETTLDYDIYECSYCGELMNSTDMLPFPDDEIERLS